MRELERLATSFKGVPVRHFISVAFVVCFGLGIVSRAQTATGLQGVWQVIEVTDQTGTNKKPQPGLYIFTKQHYSIVEVQGNAIRPDLPNAGADSTAAEILAVFGPFRSQAGTYQAANGTLSLGTMVSKNPTAMNRGTPGQGTYSIDGGILTIKTGQVVRKLKRLE